MWHQHLLTSLPIRGTLDGWCKLQAIKIWRSMQQPHLHLVLTSVFDHKWSLNTDVNGVGGDPIDKWSDSKTTFKYISKYMCKHFYIIII